jgi:hypothetical protein
MLSTYSCNSFGTGKAAVAMLGGAVISAWIANKDSNLDGSIWPETVAAPEDVGSIPSDVQIWRTAATPSFVWQAFRSRI